LLLLAQMQRNDSFKAIRDEARSAFRKVQKKE
jgi:hypothetical protein